MKIARKTRATWYESCCRMKAALIFYTDSELLLAEAKCGSFLISCGEITAPPSNISNWCRAAGQKV